MKKNQILLALVGLSFATSCSTFHFSLISESTSITEKNPREFLHSDANSEWLAIAGMNDFHGTLLPLSMKSKESNGKPVEYTTGGAATFASYVKVLRSEFGNRLLLLDAGDTYQGTLESNLHEGEATLAFLNAIGLQASTLGNHEFDYGPLGEDKDLGPNTDLLGALKNLMGKAHFDYLNTNVFERGKNRLYPFPNANPDRLYQVGNILVGVIGGSTLETPVTTRSVFLRDVSFEPLAPLIKQRAQALRQAGAHAVILTAHVGLMCARPYGMHKSIIRSATDPQGDCDKDGEMVALLNDLPKGTLDAVVSGHSHQVIHHWVNGVPVIQAGARGNYLNVVYLKFTKSASPGPETSARFTLDTKATLIEGPIPICEKVFKNQGDCNGDRIHPKGGRGRLVTPEFHGVRISPDREVASLLQPYFSEARQAQERVIAKVPDEIEHIRKGNSPLGHLIADALRELTKTDFALVNPGGIRASMPSGKLTYGDLYRILPFDNAVSILKVSGAELRKIISVAQNGARGFFPVSGMQVKVIGLDHQIAATDRDGDGKLSPWEINRLIDITTPNGNRIEDSKMYTLTTLDFLVTGGDDMGWAMKSIPKERKTLDAGFGWMRDAVETVLSHQREILAPTDIRIYQEAPPKRVSSRKRKRR